MVSRHAFYALAVLGIPVFAGCAAIDRSQPDTHTVSGSGVPVITRVAPDVASVGDSITLTGQGFSFVAPENVVAVGGSSGSADEYAIADDGTESLTFTLPDDAIAGETEILVIVEGNPSNTLPFVVEPAR